MRIAGRRGVVFREHFGGAHPPLLLDGGDIGHTDVEHSDEMPAHDLHISAGGVWKPGMKTVR
jgi:hypothetical protein